MGRSNDDYPDPHRRAVVTKVILGIVLVVLVAVDFHLLWRLWTEGSIL
jgi:hypothetical protein